MLNQANDNDDPLVTAIVDMDSALCCICFLFMAYLLFPKSMRKHACCISPSGSSKGYVVPPDVKSLSSPSSTSSTTIARGNTPKSKDAMDYEDGYISFSPRSSSDALPFDCTRKSFLDYGTTFQRPGISPTKSSNERKSSLKVTFKSPGVDKTFEKSHVEEEPAIAKSGSRSQTNPSTDEAKKLIVLLSSLCMDRQQEQDQRDALTLLRQRKAVFNVVDGSQGTHRKRREELYLISGIRARFPQFFFHYPDGTTTYLGDFKTLEKLHHAEGLPSTYRKVNQDISTWNDVFCDTSQIFSL